MHTFSSRPSAQRDNLDSGTLSKQMEHITIPSGHTTPK